MQLSLRRATGASAVLGLAFVGLQLVGAGSASAHTNVISGHATCQQDGTYTVSWTVRNDFDDKENVVLNASPGGSVVNKTLSLGKRGTGSVTQSGVPGTARTARLTADGTWLKDNFHKSAAGTVSLDGTCSDRRVFATAPSADDGGCVNNAVSYPSVTIPSTKGARYTLDGRHVRAGTRTVKAGKHLVTATSTTGKAELVGPTRWSYRLTSSPGHCTPARPVSPEVSQAACTGGSQPSAPTLTFGDTRGITYSASKSAPYYAGEKVTVTARADSDHKIGKVGSAWTKTSKTRAERTVTFAAAPQCLGTEGQNNNRLAAAGSNSSGGLAATGSRDFGPVLALGLVLIATGMLVSQRTRRRATR